MTKALFWIEASTKAGVGHLIRSIALAEELTEQNIECTFVFDEDAYCIAKTLHSWCYRSYIINDSSVLSILVEQTDKRQCNFFIADGYGLNVDIVGAISDRVDVTIVFDDGEFRLIEFADIVINTATKSFDDKYSKINPNVKICSGERFRILRKDFAEIRPRPVSERKGIVLNFGGSDPSNITIPLLFAFDQTRAQIPIRVITGAGYSHLTSLKQCLSRLSIAVQHIHNCQDMASAWSEAKLAVSAAGGSQFELGVCQTPTILLMVADNQKASLLHATTEAWCECFDMTASLGDVAQRAIQMYEDEDKLQTMQNGTLNQFDTLGAHRVVSCMMALLYD